MTKKKSTLENLFFATLLFFFSYIIFLTIKSSIILTKEFHNYSVIIPIITVIILFFIFLLSEVNKTRNTKNKFNYLLVLVIVVSIIKIVNLLLIAPSVTQISDFAVHLSNAISGDPNFSNVEHFYHWALLSKTFSVFSVVFGHTQIGGILFISVISIINTIMLYLLSNLIVNRSKYAFIISLIYAMWPSNIIYTNLFSTEHIAISLILLSSILFIKFSDKIDVSSKRKNKTLAIVIGIILGVLKFFKPVGIVLIIAGFIYTFFYKIMYKKEKRINVYKIFCYTLIIIAYLVTSTLIFRYLDHLTGQKVNRNPQSFYIYMGLSPTNDNLGLYSEEIVKKYGDYYYKYNHDFEKIGDKLMFDLKEEYKSGYEKLPAILNNKFKATWSNDLAAIGWVTNSIEEKNSMLFTKDSFLKVYSTISQMYYLIIMVLFAFGIVYTIKNSKNSNYLLFTNLFVFGFLILLLIGETQGRYKIIMYPFIAIEAFYGLKFIISTLAKESNYEEIS